MELSVVLAAPSAYRLLTVYYKVSKL